MLGKPKKGDTSRIPDAFGPCNSTLFDSPFRRPLQASAPEEGDRKPGGVKELAVEGRVEFEGSANVDFHEWANVCAREHKLRFDSVNDR